MDDLDAKRRELLEELDRLYRAQEAADLRDPHTLDDLAAQIEAIRQQVASLETLPREPRDRQGRSP